MNGASIALSIAPIDDVTIDILAAISRIPAMTRLVVGGRAAIDCGGLTVCGLNVVGPGGDRARVRIRLTK